MTLKEVLDFLGMPAPPALAAAAWGSLSAIFVMRKVTPWEAAGSFVVGMGTASYLGDYVAGMTGMTGGALYYIAGLVGMYLSQVIIETAKRWRFKWPISNSGGRKGSIHDDSSDQ